MYNNYYFNKIVLVTGGGLGIGRGLCLQLALSGAVIICADINLQKAEETISFIDKNNGKAVVQKLDVTVPEDFEGVINAIVKEHGRLDIIFNNAGIGISGELRDLSIDHWKKVIDVNFYGVLYGSQLAYQQMLKQGSGQIVNIASLAGLVSVIPLIAPYSVTKHAVVNYTRVLRMEAKAFNIKASVVCPGVVDTAIFNSMMAINAKEGWEQEAIKTFAPGVRVNVAADNILKGVANNKEVIIFPRAAGFILLISRLMKSVYVKVSNKSLKNYRDNFRINA